MTKDMQESIDWLCGVAWDKRCKEDEWILYEQFKAELRRRFGYMEAADYDAAISQYTKLNLRQADAWVTP